MNGARALLVAVLLITPISAIAEDVTVGGVSLRAMRESNVCKDLRVKLISCNEMCPPLGSGNHPKEAYENNRKCHRRCDLRNAEIVKWNDHASECTRKQNAARERNRRDESNRQSTIRPPVLPPSSSGPSEAEIRAARERAIRERQAEIARKERQEAEIRRLQAQRQAELDRARQQRLEMERERQRQAAEAARRAQRPAQPPLYNNQLCNGRVCR